METGGRDDRGWEHNEKTSFWENHIVTRLHRFFMILIILTKRESNMQFYFLIYFAGVLALTNDGGFLRVKNYIIFVGVLIHMNWILFFHHYFPVRPVNSDVESDLVFVSENQNTGIALEFDPEPPVPDPFYTETDFDEFDQYMDGEKQVGKNENGGEHGRTDGNRGPIIYPDHENDNYFERFERFENKHAKYLLYFSVYFFAEFAQLLVKKNYINKHQQNVTEIQWSNQMRTLRVGRYNAILIFTQFRVFAQSCHDQTVTSLNGLFHSMPDHNGLDSAVDDVINRERGLFGAVSLHADRAGADGHFHRPFRAIVQKSQPQ